MDSPAERTWRNRGSYAGETIDVDAVLAEIERMARGCGWEVGYFDGNGVMPYLRRVPAGMRRRVYLSAGIHGDEPGGVLTLRRLIRADDWPDDFGFWVCPCLNRSGFQCNRRENHQGIDLNRQYRHPQAEEVVRHRDWLDCQPRFDLAICLHEDWEVNGFYLYELVRDCAPFGMEGVLEAVKSVCPVETSERIEGRPASGGVVHAQYDPEMLPGWPEAFYLVDRKTDWSYTLEAPSDYPMEVRLAALETAVRHLLLHLALLS